MDHLQFGRNNVSKAILNRKRTTTTITPTIENKYKQNANIHPEFLGLIQLSIYK